MGCSKNTLEYLVEDKTFFNNICEFIQSTAESTGAVWYILMYNLHDFHKIHEKSELLET